MPDIIGFMIGVPCIGIIAYLVVHADVFSDGNIGGED